MTRVRLTRRAKNDLLDIWELIAEDDIGAADKVYARIEKRFDELADFPRLGSTRPDIGAGVRALLSGRFLILYWIEERTVTVVRVVDGVRDLRDLAGLHEP